MDDELPADAKAILDGTGLLPAGGGGLLQAAALDVRREAGAIQAQQGTGREDAERLALIQWAVRNKRVIPPPEFANRPHQHEGIEHKVFITAGSDRVEKITKDKPLFVRYHLDRLLLQNALFRDAMELEGITFHPGSPRVAVVISQPYRKGPHPEQAEIDETMTNTGFLKAATDETGRGIYRGNGVTVSDAGPKNWIKDEQTGILIPIDLHIEQYPAE